MRSTLGGLVCNQPEKWVSAIGPSEKWVSAIGPSAIGPFLNAWLARLQSAGKVGVCDRPFGKVGVCDRPVCDLAGSSAISRKSVLVQREMEKQGSKDKGVMNR